MPWVPLEPSHNDVRSPSPFSGLFDANAHKHEPPDFLYMDPELLSTLNSPRTSIDSLDDSTTNTAMMDDWQMHEVFQDISDILKETDTNAITHNDIHLPTTEGNNDLDQLCKEIFSPESPELVEVDNFPVIEPLMEADATSMDLSWIIQETLGAEAVTEKPASPDVPPHRVSVDSFDLLDQLETMSDDTPTDTCSVDSLAVKNDHQYTQLADVKVKSHETKKQAIRRVKNNAASRVCRKQRKNKLVTNISKVDGLVAKNIELRKQISDVESIVSLLKEHLVKATKK